MTSRMLMPSWTPYPTRAPTRNPTLAPTITPAAARQLPGVTLAGILDTTNFDWADKIFEVTIDLLNDKNNGFFDKELSSLGPISYELLDGACDGFTALEAYWSVMSSANAVIGARCSSASIALGWMGNVDNMAQLSMFSTSEKLSDKSEFPNFSRMVSPDNEKGEVGALIQTLALFDWNSAIVINTDTAYAKDSTISFQQNWGGNVPFVATVKVNNDGTIDEESARRVLKEAPHDDPANDSKVVILMGHDQHIFPILKLARGIFPEETFYVGTNGWASREPEDKSWMPETPGWIGVVPYRNRDAIYQKFMALVGVGTDLPDVAAEYTVDAIIAMAMALARTPSNLRRDGARITKELRSLEFDGVSGHVSFTKEGDRKDPKFSILNYHRSGKDFYWTEIGSTGIEPGSANLYSVGDLCLAGVGCNLQSIPSDLRPIPPAPYKIWVPLLAIISIVSFWLYRRKKNKALRLQKGKIAKQEAELDGFRKSVVDMCTAEQQYVPAITDFGRTSNGTAQISTARWCWRETPVRMDQWDDKDVEGNRADCWVKYDDSSTQILELAYQEQGMAGNCVPRPGYIVDFVKMVQSNDSTKWEREVKRIETATQEKALDLGQITVADNIPSEIAAEPQLVLVPGDIVQISNKRKDGWAYGSKLHMEDEPLGRRLVQLTLSKQDDVLVKRRKKNKGGSEDISSMEVDAIKNELENRGITTGTLVDKSEFVKALQKARGDDDGKYIVAYSHGWFPTNVTRVPNKDDLNTLKKTIGGEDELAPPKHWDKIVDPSVVQKSKPLDKTSKEFQDIAAPFLSTLPPRFKIVQIQRIQNLALRQSYIVKRKTIMDRDKSFVGAVGMKQALSRFEKSWLWHGTDENTVEKIIQQGFNRSFCGKNATMYGKGVYFARDASYSGCDTYSPKNSSGHKFILACSVMVGYYCKGKCDALTPELRDAKKNVLYDSTVDNVHDPSLYVTYHDAQALPEYLIVFKEGKKKK